MAVIEIMLVLIMAAVAGHLIGKLFLRIHQSNSQGRAHPVDREKLGKTLEKHGKAIEDLDLEEKSGIPLSSRGEGKLILISHSELQDIARLLERDAFELFLDIRLTENSD